MLCNAAWTKICNSLLCRYQHLASNTRYACCTILLGMAIACLPSSDVQPPLCVLVIMCNYQGDIHEDGSLAAWHLLKEGLAHIQADPSM